MKRISLEILFLNVNCRKQMFVCLLIFGFLIFTGCLFVVRCLINGYLGWGGNQIMSFFKLDLRVQVFYFVGCGVWVRLSTCFEWCFSMIRFFCEKDYFRSLQRFEWKGIDQQDIRKQVVEMSERGWFGNKDKNSLYKGLINFKVNLF